MIRFPEEEVALSEVDSDRRLRVLRRGGAEASFADALRADAF